MLAVELILFSPRGWRERLKRVREEVVKDGAGMYEGSQVDYLLQLRLLPKKKIESFNWWAILWRLATTSNNDRGETWNFLIELPEVASTDKH